MYAEMASSLSELYLSYLRIWRPKAKVLLLSQNNVIFLGGFAHTIAHLPHLQLYCDSYLSFF